ncbi:MAG: substrate-binding domain-containing protein [Candidatus Bathyarchaeia archaeon]
MKMEIKLATATVLVLATITFSVVGSEPRREQIIVSTTTSLFEIGLLDEIKEEFEKKHPSINVAFISKGTGLAIMSAVRGDSDMILVHDPERELKFMQEGYGVNRKIIAYNFFVIVGPSGDPAKARGIRPVEALKKILQAGEIGKAIWISRGDDSGTHVKEKRLWRSAGVDPESLRWASWYVEAGSGMCETLKMADEKEAYTLTDVGSYLNNYLSKNIRLEILVDSGFETINIYSAIISNPRRGMISSSKFNACMEFIRFLTSDDGQKIIGEFGEERFGRPIFNPYMKLRCDGRDDQILEWIVEAAYFDGYECPPEYRYMEDDLYRTRD